ncbi:MAG: sensor histidine kinase [Pirellulaceae bacterium]
MPPVGLRLRLVVPLAWVLIIYGGFYTYFTAKTQQTEVMAEATVSTLRLANTIRRSTRYAMLQSRREDVHKMIEEIGEQPGMDHVRIFNKEGVIAYSSDEQEINRVVDRKAEGCNQCHDSERPLTTLESQQRSRVYDAPSGHRTLAAIEVIYNEPSCWNAACHAHQETQELLGVIDVGVSLQDADRRVVRTTRSTVIFGVIATIAVCLLGASLVHRLVNRPVQRLLESTQCVAEGDLDCAIPITSADEIGQLTRSFVQMTEKLKTAQGELRGWAQKLEEEVEIKTSDLKRAQAQIIRSEKLSSVGLLAAGVAHELNSPLTGILTFAHVLAKQMPAGSEEQQRLQMIAKQAERCATIIRQLLDLSRERRPEKELHDLSALLDQSIALCEHQPRFAAIRIERDDDPAIAQVLVDAGQMQQVFVNLLVNAAEAMPAGGQLMIRTRKLTGNTSSATSVGGDAVQIVFSDSGVGIPPENLRRIFDPFFTSKDVGQGTGLGLAITHGIVEAHGGSIAVESTPGAGTTFTITIPLNGSEETSRETAARSP